MMKTLGKSQQIADAREMLRIALTIAGYFPRDGDIARASRVGNRLELLEHEADFPLTHASALASVSKLKSSPSSTMLPEIGPGQPPSK